MHNRPWDGSLSHSQPGTHETSSARKTSSRQSLSFRGPLAAFRSRKSQTIQRFGKLTTCDFSLSTHLSLVTTSLPYASPYDLPRLSVWIRNLGISLELRIGRPIEKQRSRLGHHPRPLRNRLHRKSSILSPSAPRAPRSMYLDLKRTRMLTDRLCSMLYFIRSTTRVSLRPRSLFSHVSGFGHELVENLRRVSESNGLSSDDGKLIVTCSCFALPLARSRIGFYSALE